MSKKLMIDAGHGGTDTGARAFGTNEKEWTLRMSKYQYDRLKKLGAKVSITRTDDRTLDPNPRTDLIKGKFDICISNHFNAFNGKARGIETIHSILRAKQLATDIANALVKVTGLPLRRVFTRQLEDGRDYYFMIRQTPGVDTVIIEYGFLDNQADYSWYSNKDNFYKAAEAVIEVLCRYLGVKYVSPDGSTPKPTPVPTPEPSKPSNGKSISQLADEILKSGVNGVEARAKYLGMTLAEYQPVQDEINRRYGATTPKPSKASAEKVAKDIAAGRGGWGNDPARAEKLTKEGYNAASVQKRVNEILKEKATSKPATKPKGIKVGDTVTAKALFGTSESSKNVRSSNIKGYVDTINNNWRNPIRLRNKKGGYYLGFTRLSDIL